MTSDLHGKKHTRTSPLKEWRPSPPPPWQRKQGSRKQTRAVHRASRQRAQEGRFQGSVAPAVAFGFVSSFLFFPSHFWELRQRASERPRPQGWTDTTGRLKCLDGTMDERMNERACLQNGTFRPENSWKFHRLLHT